MTTNIDLVFVMDCTGSMGPYIDSTKENIKKIITQIKQKGNCEIIKFGLIAYRDHPPQDKTFITKKFDFTEDINVMQTYLDELSAIGGGDAPEALTTGLLEANNFNWSDNSTKILILITDAPPHGLGEFGDYFPNGEPNNEDPLNIAREIAKKGITIYSVGCEPSISDYRYAKGFLISLARITGGQAISLDNSSKLADVILGGTLEEIGLATLQQEVNENLLSLKRKGIEDDAEILSYITPKLTRFTTTQVRCTTLMNDELDSNIENYNTLEGVRMSLSTIGNLPKKDLSKRALTESIETQVDIIESDITQEQIQRMVRRAKSTH
jgi:Mg-chelatase subunit ChlD